MEAREGAIHLEIIILAALLLSRHASACGGILAVIVRMLTQWRLGNAYPTESLHASMRGYLRYRPPCVSLRGLCGIVRACAWRLGKRRIAVKSRGTMRDSKRKIG